MAESATRFWGAVVLSTLLVVGCGGAVRRDSASSTATDGGAAGNPTTDGGRTERGGAGGSSTLDEGGAGGVQSAPCDADERVANHQCAPCAAGYSRPPGDDPSGADTDCTTCAADHRVMSHDCVPCPSGSGRAAGDDATGDDTDCTPTLCETDHHVVGHDCEPCAAGTYNAAGDDASETDTICDDDPCQRVLGVTCEVFEEAYLKASNADELDGFGISVSLSGETLAVGAPYEASAAAGVNGDQTDDSAGSSGAVYVFTRNDGEWTQQAYLKASNPDAYDDFGASVSLSADTLSVGAPHEDSSAAGVNGDQTDDSAGSSGAVYVFTRNDGEWTQQAYLKASNPGEGDLFGAVVSMSGDTLAVGAPSEDSAATGVSGNQSDDSAGSSGAVYVFTRNDGEWTQQAYLKASNAGESDNFGSALSLDGDRLAVASGGEASSATGVNGDQSDNSCASSGAVYVFTRGGGEWTQQAYLKATSPAVSDFFGSAVSLAGDRLAIGVGGDDAATTGVNGSEGDGFAENSGAVYVRRIAP